MLTRFALINIDEFDSVSSAYQSFLKNVLQKPVVNARQPYKRSIQALHRYASFIATCNNYDLLTDPTGSRRFICIEISGTIDNSTSINYEQLYAQAVAALKNGERYWFTSEEEFSSNCLSKNSCFFSTFVPPGRERRVWNYPPLKFSSIYKVKVALSWAING